MIQQSWGEDTTSSNHGNTHLRNSYYPGRVHHPPYFRSRPGGSGGCRRWCNRRSVYSRPGRSSPIAECKKPKECVSWEFGSRVRAVRTAH